jgi:hypothetical protein
LMNLLFDSGIDLNEPPKRSIIHTLKS